ncbi:MAG: 2Fe-2S iron-sulfur cluster-binding protein [Eisenbergiella sp.]
MSAKVLLENNPSPTREEVRDWFQKNRNLCRCTGYKPLIDAVMDAAARAPRRDHQRRPDVPAHGQPDYEHHLRVPLRRPR